MKRVKVWLKKKNVCWATQKQWVVEGFQQTDIVKFLSVHHPSSYDTVVMYGASSLPGADLLSKFFYVVKVKVKVSS